MMNPACSSFEDNISLASIVAVPIKIGATPF
jgi:hypothetical protein